jgi:sugar phosphate isomerase/epimerase
MTLMRSIACSGLPRTPGAPWASGTREAIAWARSMGARAVQLDVSAHGVLPREMDRSARRDLAAYLRRQGLAFSGADLWIPPEHFVDAAKIDRALSAVVSALEFVSEVGAEVGPEGQSAGRHVALMLPAEIGADSLHHLTTTAARVGCELADFARPAKALTAQAGSWIGYGVDPAAILIAGGDVISEVVSAIGAPMAARLSDASAFGRVAIGDGRLDVTGYEAVLEAKGFAGVLVLDVRGVMEPQRAVRAGLEGGGGGGPRG